jgi:hypothetical protein
MSKEGKLVHMSVPDFIDYRDQTKSFVGMAQIQERNSANLSIAGADPQRLNSASVGAKFFDLLGAPMQLGRGFRPEEDSKGAPRVVVLSDKLWRATFAADANVIGRPISVNGNDFTVIGVAPPTLTFPSKPDLWLPFVFEPWMSDPENRGALHVGNRTHPPWSEGRTPRRADEIDRRSTPSRVPQVELELRRHGRASADVAHWRCAKRIAHDVRRGRVRAADRLRQRCKSASRARERT